MLRIDYAVTAKAAAPFRGTGETKNVSSSGLLFRADERVPVGSHILMEMEWPRSGPDGGPMWLCASGVVVRTHPPEIAVEIGAVEFRQAGAAAVAAGAAVREEQVSPPVVLVVDAGDIYQFFRAVLSRYPFTVLQVNANIATGILAAGNPPAALLITDDVETFAPFKGRVPMIDTSSGTAVRTEAEDVIRLHKPLRFGDVRSALQTLLQIWIPQGKQAPGVKRVRRMARGHQNEGA